MEMWNVDATVDKPPITARTGSKSHVPLTRLPDGSKLASLTEEITQMPRMNDWQREVHEAVRREMWTLRGPSQIVKVVPLAKPGQPPKSEVCGYITLGRFLLGLTPQQIEHALGLPLGYLKDGARIYRFKRLPFVGEYEYELTALYPDGLAYDPAYGDPAYRPGSPHIHQWRIKKGKDIPVDKWLDLSPQDQFVYDWLKDA